MFGYKIFGFIISITASSANHLFVVDRPISHVYLMDCNFQGTPGFKSRPNHKNDEKEKLGNH